MAYPKKVPGEYADEESMTTAPKAPGVPRMVPEQVQGVRGGAPHLNQDSAVRATASLRKAWEMTGVPKDAFDRTYQRTQTGVDPGVVAQSLRRFWARVTLRQESMLNPHSSAPGGSGLSEGFGINIRSALDEQAKQLGEQGDIWVLERLSRYPEAMSVGGASNLERSDAWRWSRRSLAGMAGEVS